jgi:hypothetical protein
MGGPERVAFQPEAAAFGPWLRADGARLVLFGGQSGTPSGVTPGTWYAFETATGTLLATVESEGQGIGPYAFHRPLFDAAGERMYLPYVAHGDQATGPWPLAIAAFDLTTGEKLADRAFPDILAGSWFGSSVEQVPVNDLLTPAVALSPDGTRLAVVHADTDAVTLIDASTLAEVGTRALHRPTGLLARTLAWLGLAPRDAEAKFIQGRMLEAVFAPDGRSLYVYGKDGQVGATPDDAIEHGLGLRRIDAETGEVVAQALPGVEIDELFVAPDGKTLYVDGPVAPPTMVERGSPTMLRWLDAGSLRPLAQRWFDGQMRFLVLPGSALANLPAMTCPVAAERGGLWSGRRASWVSDVPPCVVRIG